MTKQQQKIFKLIIAIATIVVFSVPKHAQAEATECAVFKLVYERGYGVYHSTGGDEAAVRDSMDHECTRSTGNLWKFCVTFVAEYFDVMLTPMSKEASTLEAAHMMNICNANTCPAGQTLSENTCVTCEQSYYKEGSGTDPCTPCPGIGRTLPGSSIAQDHDSITDCYITSGSDASGYYSFDSGKCNYTE